MNTDTRLASSRLSYCRNILLIIVLAAVLFGSFLGNRTLSVPDEARYAEIPREMISTHNYSMPRINGVKYLEKPPLFYWMEVGSIKLFGFNNWALRLPTAIMAILGLIATYSFTQRFYNRKTAWLSVSSLATMPLYFSMAHVITLDITVAVWLSISLFSCFSAIHTQSNTHRRNLMWLAFATAGAAVLTKGLIGIILPCTIFGIWFLIFKQWRLLKKLFLPSSIIIFLIIAAPWHILIQTKAPEFFKFYFLDQQLLRYATMISHRYQPLWFYIPVVLLGAAPWVWRFFLPSSLKLLKKINWQNRQRYQTEWFLFIWLTVVILFFSLSHSKLIPYVIPALPPIAILLAKQWQSVKTFLATAIITIAVLFTALVNADHLKKDTIKPIATALLEKIKPGDKVIAYRHYYQDLPVYLRQKVIVFQSFNELTFGTLHEDTTSWMLTDPNQLMHIWNSNNTVYMVIDKEKYQYFKKQYPNNTGTILAEANSDYLVVNHQNWKQDQNKNQKPGLANQHTDKK